MTTESTSRIAPSAQGSTAPKHRRRWLRPQLSLRVLLLLVTAFAIGFPLWYVWPYTVHEYQYPSVAGQEDRTKPPQAETISSWKRTWGGEPVLHGKHILRFDNGRHGTVERTTNYVLGKRHGEYIESRNGEVVLRGQYDADEKSGTWNILEDGEPVVTQTWERGKLDGLVRTEMDGEVREYLYSDGVLTHRDGKSIDCPLLKKLAAGEIDSRQAAVLREMSQCAFVRTHLRDVIAYLGDFHDTGIMINTKAFDEADKDFDLAVTANYKGLDLATLLALITDDLGLTCDYRYGFPMVTTKEDAANWSDRTGVSALQLPAGSAIQREWDTPVTVQLVESELDLAVTQLCRSLQLPCDTSQIQPLDSVNPRFPVTTNLTKVPLKHALAILLEKTECSCELDGEKLVIKPPPQAGESP
jgi:hypothetical protein